MVEQPAPNRKRLPSIQDLMRSPIHPGVRNSALHTIGHGSQLAAARMEAHVKAQPTPPVPIVTRQMRRQLERLEGRCYTSHSKVNPWYGGA